MDRLKKIIGNISWLKRILIEVVRFKNRFINEILPEYCSASRFTSLIYYSVFSRSFLRELQAVLAGKHKHIKDSKQLKSNYFLLTRCVHRLEKGLLMRPRKEIFGKSYIEETVDSYIGIMKKNSGNELSNPQLLWFDDVLHTYFSAVGSDSYIERQKKRFVSFRKKHPLPNSNGAKRVPYHKVAASDPPVSFDDLYELSLQRRSVRWFRDQKVPRRLIDKALSVAVQAPSACNRQPFEYRIFDEPELVNKIINIPMGTRGYAHNVPVVAVSVGNLDAYFDERDRHLIYIDASLANMLFMLTLETLGLSSCPINWPDIEAREHKMEEILDLKLYQRPIMLMAIGYPDEEGKVAYSEKRPVEMIRSYNR